MENIRILEMMVWDVLDGDFIWDLGSCVLFIDWLRFIVFILNK